MFGRKKTSLDRYAVSETKANFYSKYSHFEPIITGVYEADHELVNYMYAVQNYVHELEHEKASLERELEAIKPILEHPDYKPAASSSCNECKFAAYSHWSGKLVGCKKDMLCRNFQPVEKEK